MLRVALVNNMPSSALVDTERRFARLLRDAVHPRPVETRLYSLPAIVRTGAAAGRVATAYRPISQMWADQPDVVVVTGAEPTTAALEDEPYWPALATLLTTLADGPVPALLSCLAAHAALATLDGLQRRPLGEKCSGVFSHRVAARGAGVGPDAEVAMPHSRTNEVPTSALTPAGWVPLLVSDVGWGAAARERAGAGSLLAVQGHPEYDGSTLLREWRRDLLRHIRGERPDIAAPPVDAAAPEDASAVRALSEALVARGAGGDSGGGGDPHELVAAFPWDIVMARAPEPWRPAAVALCRAWLVGAGALRTAPDDDVRGAGGAAALPVARVV